MPSDSRLLPFRSNVPHLANYCFEKIDSGFAERCKNAGACAIIGGDNYGQGSSREHAALAPLHLGVKFVIAKSFARIHRSNLINSGIMPLVFDDPSDYDDISLGDKLVIENAVSQISQAGGTDLQADGAAHTDGHIDVKNETTGKTYKTHADFSELEAAMILAGGKINYLKQE